MPSAFSSFLDICRLYAAVCVFVSHASVGCFGDIAFPAAIAGHDAVIVFFVLSGYVIAYSQQQRPRTLPAFVAARFVRMYSTLLPALILTFICTLYVGSLQSSFAISELKSHEAVRLLACGLFAQEAWFRNLTPGINGALWSLGYELPYYLLFAFVCIRGVRASAALISVLLALSGVNIWLLAPAWFLGVLSQRSDAILANMGIALLVTALGAAISALLIVSGWHYPMHPGSPPLNFASAFASDTILAIGIAAIFAGMRALLSFDIPTSVAKCLRFAGDLTFPIYVVHQPVLAVFAAASGAASMSSPREDQTGLLLAAIASVLLLSIAMEALRPRLRKTIESSILSCWPQARINGAGA